MGRHLIDKSGRRYGRLVVLAYAGISYGGYRQYLCRCDCGREWYVSSQNLHRKGTMSCGCSRFKNTKEADL